MGENENDDGGREAKSDGVGGGEVERERQSETEREIFTANRPGGFNHSKTLNSYWGYQNIL